MIIYYVIHTIITNINNSFCLLMIITYYQTSEVYGLKNGKIWP